MQDLRFFLTKSDEVAILKYVCIGVLIIIGTIIVFCSSIGALSAGIFVVVYESIHMEGRHLWYGIGILMLLNIITCCVYIVFGILVISIIKYCKHDMRRRRINKQLGYYAF